MSIEEVIAQSRASIEKADLKVLLPIIAEIEPRVILEIGTWCGYSADVWWKSFTPQLLATMENNPDSIAFWEKRKLKGEFDYMKKDPGTFYLIDQSSHDPEAMQQFLSICKFAVVEPVIDFLFIDGDHSYYGVQKDYEMYSPLVRKGGIIAFHDAMYHADKTEEVDEFWDRKIRKHKPERYFEIKASKNSTGIGVLFV